MNCARCGAANDVGQRFCHNCGSRLESVAPGGLNVPQLPPAAPPTTQLPPAGLPPTPPPYDPGAIQGAPPAFGVPHAPMYAPVVTNSTLAIVSLVSGILSWVFLPFIGSIVAVVTGHMARSEINKSGGTIGGQGLALAGLILGYVQLAFTVLLICGIMALVVIGGASTAP